MRPLIVIAIACGVLMFILHDWDKQRKDEEDNEDNWMGFV